jgi:carboxymethylenebutenolidase
MRLPTIERDTELGRYHSPDSAPGDGLPSLVFIHDVWGLSEHSRDLAKELASEGFGVLEIDLYREMGEVSIEAPGPFIRSLSDPRVLADLDAGADWLERETNAGAKIGVMGVCMGGTYALLAACLSDRFAASAPFYGILSYETGMLANPSGRDFDLKPAAPLDVASRLKMPLLASFGAEDDFVPPEDVRDLEARLRESGMPWRVEVYAGAGHAFLNRTREAAYRSEASAQAWAELIPFLHEHLD